VKEKFKGSGGAYAHILGEIPKEEPTVHMRLHSNNTFRYGTLPREEAVVLAEIGNHHIFLIVPACRKRKFMLECDNGVHDDGSPPEEH
jgi:hypothetical protein